MAGEKRAPGAEDDGTIDVEGLFDDLFDEAPATDPAVPALGDEVTLEVPAAGGAGGEPAGEASATEGPEGQEGPEGPEEPEGPALFAPMLPEMDAEIWQAGIQALVSVPEHVEPPPVPPEAWVEEARLFQVESGSAETPVLQATLLTAAARAAELGGAIAEAARAYDEALVRSPTAADALRARARLAEGLGDFDEAHAHWARLALSAGTTEERAFYAALAAEWTLARRGALPAVSLDAIPAGPARALAVAEEALRGGNAGTAASAFGAAGRALGGPVGAAFLGQAARFAAVARDTTSATAYRGAARKVEPTIEARALWRVQDAARADARTAPAKVAALPALFPSGSSLTGAVGRWAGAVARQRGDAAGALATLTALGDTTVAAARDRIDLEIAAGAPLDPTSLERLRAAGAAPAAEANLVWIEAGDLIRRGEHAAALDLLARAIEAHADAVPLALLAERIAVTTADSELRAFALDLWLRGDPARRAAAALALAEAREGTGGGLAARAALQTAVESAPDSSSFWRAAAADASAGRVSDAAATLGFGAEIWGASALAPGLRALAAVKHAASDPARVLAALGTNEEGGLSDAALALGAVAVARLAERAADRPMAEAALDALAEAADPGQRAWAALRWAASLPDDELELRGRALDAALEGAPAHPLALALRLAGASEAGDAAVVLARAGRTASDLPSFGRTVALAATSALALAGERQGALDRSGELLIRSPGDPAARTARVRAAVALGGEAGTRALAALPVDPGARDDAAGLAIAEARADAGMIEAASEALQSLAGGRFASDVRRMTARLDPSADGIPRALRASAAAGEVGGARATITALADRVAAGAWSDLCGGLAAHPPHEASATPETLAFAALVAEAHDVEVMAERLSVQAVSASRATRDADPLPSWTLARVADSGVVATKLRARALTLMGAWLGPSESDRSSAAALLTERARLEEAAGDSRAALETWRAALAVEPTFLAAAHALRTALARAGDPAAASAACEAEAACLMVPAHRVRALMLASALAQEARPEARERPLALLRAALAVDPGNDGAFERLRALLTEQDDVPALSAALAARIGVAQNPFEVTSLRLARAALLADRLSDWDGAREELEAVLRKQLDHARALERLSSLLWSRGAWSEAGEIDLRRAVVERDPAALRAIFLRLGDIYSNRAPDPKRAAAAYERVLSIDPMNLEALRALSDLTVAEGDLRRALPVADRLAACEPDPVRRQQTRVRLGQLLMETGDLRRAAAELRRVVDEAPRDVTAVTALAHLLDRARDQAGRRSVLDWAIGILRHDLRTPSGLTVETLRALANLLALRERPHAALAAAQLVAALGAGAKEGVREATRLPRSLAALRRPEVDERAFSSDVPPGLRQILRQLGPSLRPSANELGQRLGRYGVTRGDRRTRGTPLRRLFDAVAAELGVGDFDLYVTAMPAAAGPIPLRAEPGSPPSLIVGAALEELAPAALRFAAARLLRLAATQMDQILANPAEQAGALLVAIIRQFVPDFTHPEVREELVMAEVARVERVISRKLKPQLMPFAVESAGPFDLGAFYAGVRDGANAVGLLAAADLPAALSVLLEIGGTIVAPLPPGGPGLTLAAIGANQEALALVQFAVSEEHDELASALES